MINTQAPQSVRTPVKLSWGWYLIMTEDGVWFNTTANVQSGVGFCIGSGLDTHAAQTDAVKNLEEALDILQFPF